MSARREGDNRFCIHVVLPTSAAIKDDVTINLFTYGRLLVRILLSMILLSYLNENFKSKLSFSDFDSIILEI